MIRKAHLSDLEAIHQLYIVLFEGMANLVPDYLKPAEQERDFLLSVLRGENDMMVFVVEEEADIKGFAIAQLQNTPPYTCMVQQRSVYLIDLVVDPRSRSKGYGKQLLDAVKEWGTSRQVSFMELSVLAKNTKAVELYEREGFEAYDFSMRIRLDDK